MRRQIGSFTTPRPVVGQPTVPITGGGGAYLTDRDLWILGGAVVVGLIFLATR